MLEVRDNCLDDQQKTGLLMAFDHVLYTTLNLRLPSPKQTTTTMMSSTWITTPATNNPPCPTYLSFLLLANIAVLCLLSPLCLTTIRVMNTTAMVVPRVFQLSLILSRLPALCNPTKVGRSLCRAACNPPSRISMNMPTKERCPCLQLLHRILEALHMLEALPIPEVHHTPGMVARLHEAHPREACL